MRSTICSSSPSLGLGSPVVGSSGWSPRASSALRSSSYSRLAMRSSCSAIPFAQLTSVLPSGALSASSVARQAAISDPLWGYDDSSAAVALTAPTPLVREPVQRLPSAQTAQSHHPKRRERHPSLEAISRPLGVQSLPG